MPLENKEHSRSEHVKGPLYPSFPPSSENSHYTSSCCYQIEKLFHTLAYTLATVKIVQLQSVHATEKQGTHFMRHSRLALHAPLLLFATLALCDHKTPCTSFPPLSSIGPDTSSAFLSQSPRRVLGAFLAVGWLCSSVVLESCSSGVHRNMLTCVEKTFFSSLREVHTRVRNLRQILSDLICRLETALLMAWRERSALPRSSCSDDCPFVFAHPKKKLPALAK